LKTQSGTKTIEGRKIGSVLKAQRMCVVFRPAGKKRQEKNP